MGTLKLGLLSEERGIRGTLDEEAQDEFESRS